MTYHFQNPSDAIVKHYLNNSKVIAVVGLSDREETTSNRVSKEMQERGYRIIPVNPRAAGSQIFGETVYASLKDIPFPVDIVDVYRRSEFLPDVALDFLPKVKMEIVVPDDLLEQCLETIVETCQTGKIGDGKIFVYDVERVIRVRTGEENEEAI